MAGLIIELPTRKERTEFNLRRWEELLNDPVLAKIEGRIETLLRQMTRRFGPLTDDVAARVRNATTPTLDDWIDRILTAATLDELLDPR